MKREDLVIVSLLFLLLFAWLYSTRSKVPPQPVRPDVAEEAVALESSPLVEGVDIPEDLAIERPQAEPIKDAPAGVMGRQREEKVCTLANDLMTVSVSSWGGAVSTVRLEEYRDSLDPDSPPVVLDFGDRPALELTGVPWLPEQADFEIDGGGDAVVARRALPGGLTLERLLSLRDDYALEVVDTFTNTSSVPVSVSSYGVRLGPMSMIQSKTKTRGISYLGIDSLEDVGGERVSYWLKTGLTHKSPILQRFNAGEKEDGTLPRVVALKAGKAMVWASVKNKFFAQILVPDRAAADCNLHAARDMEERRLTVNEVWADLVMDQTVLQPGESMTRTFDYFVGPKKFAILKQRPHRQGDIMEFGRYFGGISKFLLTGLNWIHAGVRNYGIAIIILTALVRIIFWPITHKSTESMKKMQKIQPQVQELREKYKDKPQKMNQEVMALYKVHKVNPMAGCLPIVVQIPVFIALFTVLRSAIELRFAGFLWISDLSEPEGLFASMIPFAGGLNILPLLMTATMVWQQRLTPSAGDPQQQKMFMFMPVVMLFIFYSMASALVLYWTTSQTLSIVQLLMQRRKTAREEAAGQGAAPAAAAEPAVPKPSAAKKRKKKR